MSLTLPYRRTILSSLAVTSLFLGAAACASTGHSRGGSPCQLRVNDTTFAAGRTLYRDCAVDKRATLLTTNIRPDFTPTPRPGTACHAADLEFVVDTTGLPELGTARIARSNDHDYADALFATLPSWKYEPARLQGRPVRQLVLEHRSIVTATVVVPAGSPPPTHPPAPVAGC